MDMDKFSDWLIGLKHGKHDQSSHGKRGGSRATTSQATGDRADYMPRNTKLSKRDYGDFSIRKIMPRMGGSKGIILHDADWSKILSLKPGGKAYFKEETGIPFLVRRKKNDLVEFVADVREYGYPGRNQKPLYRVGYQKLLDDLD